MTHKLDDDALNALSRIRSAGLDIIPLGVRSKLPKDKGFLLHDYGDWDFQRHVGKGGNLGIRARAKDLIIDVDPKNGGEESFAALQWECDDDFSRYPYTITGSGGRHIYMSKPEEGRWRWHLKGYRGIDFQSLGRYVVAPGSIHPETGNAYTFHMPSGADFNTAAPSLLLDLLRKPERASSNVGSGVVSRDDLRDLLSKLDPADFGKQGEHHDEWLDLAMAAHHATGGDGMDEWLEWCAQDEQYGEDASRLNAYRWDSFDEGRSDGITYKTLLRAVSRVAPKAVAGLRLAGDAAKDFADDLDDEVSEDAAVTPGDRVAGLTTIRASNIIQKPIQWLWRHRYAIGKLSGIAGVPDQGKSQVTIAIAAVVTNGGLFPDGARAPLGDVILMSAEDDPADTTAPRLTAAGADLERVRILNMLVKVKGEQRMFSLKDDVNRLRELLRQNPAVKLIVVDPISAYMGAGSVDTFKNSDVRAVLAPLSDLAAETGVAVIYVSHFNKSGTGGALNRVTDSLAFTALARSFWAVLPELDDSGDATGRKLMVRIKQNIAAPVGGLAYHIESVVLHDEQGNEIHTSKVVWDGVVDKTADEVLNSRPAEQGTPKQNAAKLFLVETLEYGPVESGVMYLMAEAQKIAARTLDRAKTEMGVTSVKIGAKWYWTAGDD